MASDVSGSSVRKQPNQSRTYTGFGPGNRRNTAGWGASHPPRIQEDTSR